MPDSARPARFTLVTSPNCHFCDDAHRVLDGLAARGVISLEVHAVASDEGARLMAEHRAPQFPLILMDGRFYGAGRLRRPRLERVLRLERGAA